MSTTSAPFGLQPIYHPSGSVRPQAFTLTDSYGTQILQNQPVKIDGTTGTLVPAAIGDAFIGVFQGCEYTDADGRRRVTNKWIASNYGTNIIAYATSDPYIVYQIQTNATMAVTAIGGQYNTTAITAGSTTTGLSALMLDTATTNPSSANNQMRVVGITPSADNNWDDSFVIVQVEISKHQFVATIVGF